MSDFKVCLICRQYFQIEGGENCAAGSDCHYCDDLTGRPHYKPFSLAYEKLEQAQKLGAALEHVSSAIEIMDGIAKTKGLIGVGLITFSQPLHDMKNRIIGMIVETVKP